MTPKQAFTKIISGWWALIIVVLIASYLSFSLNGQKTYTASVTVSMPINGEYFAFSTQYQKPDADNKLQQETLSLNGSNTLLDASGLLTNRYVQVDTQAKILSKIGITPSNLSSLTPPYSVLNSGLGYTNITYTAKTEDQAHAFVQAVKDVNSDIVDVWNKDRPNVQVKINPDNYREAVIENRTPIQVYAVPVVVASLACIAVLLLLPSKKK